MSSTRRPPGNPNFRPVPEAARMRVVASYRDDAANAARARRAAEAEGISVGEWVRNVVRAAAEEVTR